MSNDVFPSLPGIALERDHEVEFDNIVRRAASGKRYAMGKRLYPVRRWMLRYNFLRERAGRTELQQLQGFFERRHGNLDDFLFRDREVYQITTPQIFATGDGTTRRFRLVRSRGGFLEPIGYAPAATVRVNGTPTTAFTLDNDGWLEFTTAPALNAVCDWTTALFYFRVAFVKPSMSFTQFVKDLYDTGVEIETVNR